MDSVAYQVTIKSANQKVDDYVTECQSDWTVLRLKQHISETHVNKPSVSDQRLIYAGNLLKDSLTLKQIFFRDSLCTELTNSNKTDFTIHIVCSTHSLKSSAKPSTSSSTERKIAPNTAAATTAASISSATLNPTPTASSSGVSQQGVQSSQNVTNQTSRDSSTSQTGPTPSSTADANTRSSHPLSMNQASEIARSILQSGLLEQQLSFMQQLADAFAQEVANTLANTLQNAPIVHDPTNQTPSSNGQAIGQQADGTVPATTATQGLDTFSYMDAHLAASAVASQFLLVTGRDGTNYVSSSAQAVETEGNRNEDNRNDQAAEAQFGVIGAQLPIAEAPEAEARNLQRERHDIIEWVYYSVRAIVLVAALYIHASLFRLLFILGIIAIAYFFNRRARRGAVQNREEAAPAAQERDGRQAAELAAQQADQDAAGQLRRRNLNGREQNVDNGEDNQNPPQQQAAAAGDEDRAHVAQRRVPFLKLCYLVVTDFLASLVPE